MWKCPNCETLNQGTYCEVCGSVRPKDEHVQSRETQLQPPAGGIYRPRDFGEPEARKTPLSEDKTKQLIIIVLVMAALLIAVLFLLLGIVLGSNSDSASQKSVSPTASSESVLDTPEPGLISEEPEKTPTPTPVYNLEPEDTPTPTKTPKPTSDTYPKYNSQGVFYRVRKSANDAQSQIGAFVELQNAINQANQYKAQGYEVYDNNGKLIYVP